MEFHEGKWLKERVADTKANQSQFARKIGLPVRSVTRWFRQKTLKIRGDNLTRVAEGLGMEPLSFKIALDLAKQPVHGRLKGTPLDLSEGMPLGCEGQFMGKKGPVDPNKVTWAPILNRIASGRPADYGCPVQEWDNRVPMLVGDAQVFGLYVDGESMLPRYEHGDIVMFEVVDRWDVVDGRDYAIQFGSDGNHESTFKVIRLDRKDESRFFADARNEHFTPRRMTIQWSKVIRLGKVRMIIPRQSRKG